jgi:hypothetical protein
MLAFEPMNSGLDVAVVLLSSLPMDEALALLQARRDAITARRAEVAAELGEVAGQAPFARIAADHLLSLIDAELGWIDRSITSLHPP